MAKRSPPSSRTPSKVKTGKDAKAADLQRDTEESADTVLTSNQGVPVNDDHNSLKVGDRGPTLLEDFLLREKITHFDHERIPERVVHARGSGAHGYFELDQSLAKYTRAAFLQEPGSRTPVFVRFSTVAGSRGSTDLAQMSADSPSSSTPNKETSTSSATTCRCSSFRTPSNFRI